MASGDNVMIMIDCLISADFVSLYSGPKGISFSFPNPFFFFNYISSQKCFRNVGLTEFEILH